MRQGQYDKINFLNKNKNKYKIFKFFRYILKQWVIFWNNEKMKRNIRYFYNQEIKNELFWDFFCL